MRSLAPHVPMAQGDLEQLWMQRVDPRGAGRATFDTLVAVLAPATED
jgi:hypothetical protein